MTSDQMSHLLRCCLELIQLKNSRSEVLYFEHRNFSIEIKFECCILDRQHKEAERNSVVSSLSNREVQKMWELESLGVFNSIEVKTKKVLDEEILCHFQER